MDNSNETVPEPETPAESLEQRVAELEIKIPVFAKMMTDCLVLVDRASKEDKRLRTRYNELFQAYDGRLKQSLELEKERFDATKTPPDWQEMTCQDCAWFHIRKSRTGAVTAHRCRRFPSADAAKDDSACPAIWPKQEHKDLDDEGDKH